MKTVIFGAILAFNLFGAGGSQAASCKSGQITCEQWCHKYAADRGGTRAIGACFNSCQKKKNKEATCVNDK